jgi:hypothetical protein
MNEEPKVFSGVSEQGRNGLLWTIFEGEPLCGRRVASFVDRKEAWEYIEFRRRKEEAKQP